MTALVRASAFVLLTACTGTSSTDTGVVGTSTTPLWTVADVSDQWAQLVEVGLPNPYSVKSEYLDYHALGDETCPGTETDNLAQPNVTLMGCYSADGILYAGEFVWMDEEGEYSDKDADWTYANFGTQVADFTIESPDGTRMSGGGRLFVNRAWQEDGKTVVNTAVNGTWSYTASQYPWFAQGISSYLELRVEGDAARTEERLEEFGVAGSHYSLSGTYGIPGVSVQFERLSMGSGCDLWPSDGAASVRSDDGTWYRIDYAGNEDCDACGEVIWDGRESLGEACPNFSGLLPWLDPSLLGYAVGDAKQ